MTIEVMVDKIKHNYFKLAITTIFYFEIYDNFKIKNYKTKIVTYGDHLIEYKLISPFNKSKSKKYKLIPYTDLSPYFFKNIEKLLVLSEVPTSYIEELELYLIIHHGKYPVKTGINKPLCEYLIKVIRAYEKEQLLPEEITQYEVLSGWRWDYYRFEKNSIKFDLLYKNFKEGIINPKILKLMKKEYSKLSLYYKRIYNIIVETPFLL